MLRNQIRTANSLSINEIYETIQGEGLLVGTPSLFIRLQGCNLRCPWCDQPSALEFDRKNLVDVEEVVNRAKTSPFRHVVITGGEPFAQPNLHVLVRNLLEEDFSVQIETNGTLWNEGLRDFVDRVHITCSPKAVAKYFVHPEILKHADEIKFVVDENLRADVLMREDFIPFLKRELIVLQPESNRQEMFKAALSIQRKLAQKGFSVRIISQIHKFFGMP